MEEKTCSSCSRSLIPSGDLKVCTLHVIITTHLLEYSRQMTKIGALASQGWFDGRCKEASPYFPVTADLPPLCGKGKPRCITHRGFLVLNKDAAEQKRLRVRCDYGRRAGSTLHAQDAVANSGMLLYLWVALHSGVARLH